jgi:hypothetical protein
VDGGGGDAPAAVDLDRFDEAEPDQLVDLGAADAEDLGDLLRG